MRVIGRIKDVCSSRITFEIDEDFETVEKAKKYGDKLVVLNVAQYREKRSLSANGYFWVLVDQIAQVLGTDKNSIYLWMLRDGGVSVPLLIKEEAIDTLTKSFRLVEQIGQRGDMVEVLAYYGTSTYDTKEMARIIDITRQEAIKLGIDVWTKDEIQRLLEDMQ